MSAGGETYGEAYFSTTYRDYLRQNPARKLEFYRSVVEHHLPKQTPTRLLDIGCGMGGFLACLREADPERRRFIITGIDVSEYAIAASSKRLPGETFKVAASDQIAAFDQRFEVVTAFDVLEHLQSPDETALAISRCLAADGTLVLVVPVFDGPLGPIVRLLDQDPSHVQLRSRQWWLEWTSLHFTIRSWLGIFRMLTPWHHYIHQPTKSFRKVTPAILIVATPKDS